MTASECAAYYQNFIGSTCKLTLENGLIISFPFKRSHFKHLLGLEKLKDIPNMQSGAANAVFKNILAGKLDNAISKSAFYHLIEDRLKYFNLLDDILHSKIVIDFEPSIVQDGTHLSNTAYILFLRKNNGYINLTLGEGFDGYYPETFFFEPSKRYISEQTLLDIISVEIIPK